MKRDSIFYKLFAQSPTLLFDLIADKPKNAGKYRFDSVAVKEPRFEIDGVFLPPTDSVGVIYFCEVQFQKDEQLYERILAEIALYFYQNRLKFRDWQVVVIYPSRKTEQKDLYPHRSFLNGGQVHRIYLDELSNIRQLPLRVSLMALTTVEKNKTVEEARYLSDRASQELPAAESRDIIEMVLTIVSHRFEQLSRQEIEAMMDITVKETRFFRELREEAEQEGRQSGMQQGRQEGMQQGAAMLVLSLLTDRFGELSSADSKLVSSLPLQRLEELNKHIVGFSDLADLQSWLASKPSDSDT